MKEHTPTPSSDVFVLQLAFESIKEFGGASGGPPGRGMDL
jgi:hypothetical protein